MGCDGKIPKCACALEGWYRVMKKNQFDCFAALKNVFNSVDKVGHLYVFNIGGNKMRLIAIIHFGCFRVYIRNILTHASYDKEQWKH